MFQTDAPWATIRIKNLRLRTYIGIKTEEIENQQDIIINVVIDYIAHDAIQVNEISHALNYRTITKEIIQLVEGNRFQLLENMTQQVLALVCDSPTVMKAQVEIDKPHALRFADSVSMTLRFKRDNQE